MKNGVYPVDRFGVVLILHSTDGSSSSQHPGDISTASMSLGLIPESTKAFVLSTWPLPWGCATEHKSSRMFLLSQNRLNSPWAKFVPLSVMILCGYPYRRITSFRNFTAVWPSHFAIGFTSSHLVNLSTITKMWVMFPLAVLNGPTMSRHQTAKGQVRGMVLLSIPLAAIAFPYQILSII